MCFFKRLLAILMTVVLLGPMLPLEAKAKKGDRYLAEGRAHEEKKEWDAALESYEKALSEDPAELVYQMAAQKARFEASAMHVTNGIKIRAQGQLGEALLEFQKGFALNPSSSAAEQEILRTQQMIQRERKRVEDTGREAPPEVRGMTLGEQAKKDADERIDRLQPLPELKPLKPNQIDFKINNQPPKVLFDTLAMTAGINVIYDPDYLTGGPKDKMSVTFTNSTLQDALDYLAVLTKSFWKPLSPNAIFVTMDNTNKRRDYEEEVTRVFYLTNITAQADLTAISTVARTVGDCQRVFPFEPLNAIVAKCTGDRMALTEKLIHDLDKPKSEVVVDIFVMEASSVYLRSLSAAISSAGSNGLNLPVTFTPRASLQVQQAASSSSTTTGTTTTGTTTGSTTSSTGTTSTTTGTAIPFSHIGQVNAGDFATVLPNAVLQATLSDTRTKVLQSPQIRTVDGQKASMKIGEKEPTASGSFGSGLGSVAGAGISPLVNTQFTYLDIGVNVEITSHVHDNGDISLHVNLEISNVTGQANLGGINEPIIGQRKLDQDIRLREGEISLLGGLLNQSDTKTKTGVPGLANIPILGRLFSGDSVDRERDELVIALVPHIVRRPDITAENMRAVASGPQNQVTVKRAPKPVEPDLEPPPEDVAAPAAPAANKPAAQPAPGALPAAPVPAPPPAAVMIVPPAPAPGPAGPQGPLPPATAPPETPSGQPGPGALPRPPAAPVPPAGPVKIHFSEAQLEKNAGETFTVTIQVEDAKDVSSAPIALQYDPKILSLNDVAFGKFWAADGQEPIMVRNVQNDAGTAAVNINRKPGSAAVSGSGTLLTLTFKALAPGSATISAANVTLSNSQNQRVGMASPKLTVTVK